MTVDGAQELLARLCADLRLLRLEAGGPSLRALGAQLGVSKSQLGAILNGQVRDLPDWRVVRGVVEGSLQHARKHERAGLVSLPVGVEEFWRHRYGIIDHAFNQARRSRSTPPPRLALCRPLSASVTPRQLPAAVRHFVGRAAQLAELTGLLDEASGAASTVVTSAISGTAGVGKTALAVHWAHQVADRFPDGHLYLNLRGFDPAAPPVSPAAALRSFLEAFTVSPESVPSNLEARAGLYRSLLAGKRVLVVLDNARDPEQVRPLLPATPGCLALVTSRNRLAGLVATDDVHPILLDLMSPEEAHDMLRRRLGGQRVAAEPDAVTEILTRCARLPLAIAVAATRAVVEPGRPLRSTANELRRARESLEVFASEDPPADLRAVFSCSYDTLSPGAARLFRLLALAPGTDIALPAAAGLLGLSPERTRLLLAELTRAQLHTEHLPGRYTFHGLLRAYAIEQVHAHEPADERHAAVRRILDHYLHTAHAADRALDPHRQPITLDLPLAGAAPESIGDQRQAITWFTAERATLLDAVDQARGSGLHVHAWQLASTLMTFFERQGHGREWANTREIGLDAARRISDRNARALARHSLTRARTLSGSIVSAGR